MLVVSTFSAYLFINSCGTAETQGGQKDGGIAGALALVLRLPLRSQTLRLSHLGGGHALLDNFDERRP